MSLVIDASVALKWVLPEAGSLQAASIAATKNVIAPDLLLLECANVLWLKQRRGQLTAADADTAFAVLETAPLSWTSTPTLLARARILATLCDVTAYDATYLALAQSESAGLATADARLAEAATRLGLPGPVRLVGNSAAHP